MKQIIVFFHVFCLFFGTCFGFSSNSVQPFGADNRISSIRFYQTISDISLEALKEFPPEDCIIIGLGRSPILLTTFLQLFLQTVYNLPLSKFKYHPNHADYPPLSENNERRLHLHFKDFLPPSETFEGKRVMLLDFGITGESIFSAQFYLQRFLKAIDINSFVLTGTSSIVHDRAREMGVTDYKVRKISPFLRFGASLTDFQFDHLAPYGESGVNDWGRIKMDSTEHDILKETMQFHIDRDKTLAGINQSNYARYLPQKRKNCVSRAGQFLNVIIRRQR